MLPNNDPIRYRRFQFAVAAVLAAEGTAPKLRAAIESLDVSDDREFAAALRRLERLAEDTESAYRLAREALADAAEAYE